MINAPIDLVEQLFNFTTNIFSGFSGIIILVIAIVLGFWIFGVIIDIVANIWAEKREMKEIKLAVETLRIAGFTITEKIPITQKEMDIRSAVAFLRRKGFIVSEK